MEGGSQRLPSRRVFARPTCFFSVANRFHLAILRLARPQPMTIIPRAALLSRRDASAGRTHQRAPRLSSQLTQHSVRTGPLPVYTLLRVCPTPHAVAHGVCECSRLPSHRRRCAAPRPTCNHITLAHNARDAPRSTSARTHPRQSSEWGNVSRCARPPPRGLQPCAAAPSIMRVLAILRRASLPPVALPATSASPHLRPPWRAIAPAANARESRSDSVSTGHRRARERERT